MKSLDLTKWKQLIADVGNGLKQDVVAIKRRALVVRRRTAGLGEESARKYRLLMLKVKKYK